MDLKGLSILCSGLGVVKEDEDGNRIGYSKGQNCADNLKDLLRFLRRDDPQNRQVFNQLCKWNIVSKYLVPMVEYCQHDHILVLNVVKVLVFLTMPVDPSSSDIPQQVEYLWGLKYAITCSNTVAVIVSLLEDPLQNLESESFTEDNWKLVQLILTLFRNILAIQDISIMQKSGKSASELLTLRDKFLELLFHENVMDLVIVITQHVGGSGRYFCQDNLLLLEIYYYVIIGQEPELIAKAHLKDSKVNTKASLDNLKSLMEEEREKRKLFRLQNLGRHTQFSGTFERITMDGSKAVVKGHPTSASSTPLLKSHKAQHSTTKKIVWDYGKLPSAKDDILWLLHNFIGQFLEGGYNVLMHSVRKDIEKERHGIQNSDIIVFFHVAQFVTSFQYHKLLISKPDMEKVASEVSPDKYDTVFRGDVCGPVAESMNDSMFLLVISRWREAFEGLKEISNYKFLSAAGSLMKTMICMLDLVLKLLPEDTSEPQTTRILLYKLFYDQTEEGMTQFLLKLIKSFNTHKQPKSDLADLVEIIQLIVQLMESLQARGALRVSKSSRKRRKKKATDDETQVGNELSRVQANQIETVICNSEQLTDFGSSCHGNHEDDASDWKNDTPIPIIDAMGISEISVREDANAEAELPQIDKTTTDCANDDLLCSNNDSSDDELHVETAEVDFKVSTFISGLAHSSLIQNLSWLLKFYKSNSNNTNQYIISMLRRITEDLDLAPMLYQLSLFKTFYDILVEQKAHPCEQYKDIVGFLTGLVREMLKKMRKQPLLFIEVLFWKTRKECHYINTEHMLHEVGNMRKKTSHNGASTEETGASPANQWTRRSQADALGDDEADVVISHELGSQDEKLVVEEKSRKFSGRKRLILTDDLELKIKDLYEKFKGDSDCSRLIAQSLDPDGKVSAAQVCNKLKQLGLQVLSKKRKRSTGIYSPVDSDEHGKEERNIGGESFNQSSVEPEGPLLSQPLKTRKRVSFSEDQEAMVKALFEQFKGHRRCSYMIANALEAENTFTAAQVSRKLKELGLIVPRRKISEVKIPLRAEKSDQEGLASDDETLFSFRDRPKERDQSSPKLELNNEQKVSDDSDNEYISTFLKPKNKDVRRSFSKELLNENREREALNVSDDETLNAHIRSKNVTPLVEINGNQGVAFSHVMSKGSSDAGVSTNTSSNKSDEMNDDLADSGDDTAPDAFMQTAVHRRKLRMVIEEDE